MILTMPVNRSKIKHRRKALGLTLQAAAEGAGWKVAQQWKKIEDQKLDLRISTIERIAKALKCTREDILD
jgi:predicted transcriptional regulator